MAVDVLSEWPCKELGALQLRGRREKSPQAMLGSTMKQKCSQTNGVPVPREDSAADEQQRLASNGGRAAIPSQQNDCKQYPPRVNRGKTLTLT